MTEVKEDRLGQPYQIHEIRTAHCRYVNLRRPSKVGPRFLGPQIASVNDYSASEDEVYTLSIAPMTRAFMVEVDDIIGQGIPRDDKLTKIVGLVHETRQRLNRFAGPPKRQDPWNRIDHWLGGDNDPRTVVTTALTNLVIVLEEWLRRSTGRTAFDKDGTEYPINQMGPMIGAEIAKWIAEKSARMNSGLLSLLILQAHAALLMQHHHYIPADLKHRPMDDEISDPVP